MSLKRSASQVSPQVLSLLALYPNIPDEPPKARSLVASPSELGLGCAAQVSFCCLVGLRLTRARTHAFRRSLFGYTLSERRGPCSMPRGFAYCESSRERWFGSPAGQHLSSPPLILRLSSPGTALVSSHTSSSQQSPTLWLRLAPSATP